MRLFILVPAILITVLPGCTTTPSEVPADPSYATNVQPIFSGNCISCHGGASPSGGYSLMSRAGAIGPGSDTIPNVIPNSADLSRLYRRITGAELPQMPLGGTPLDTVKIATIRNWINQGAKDN